MMASPLNANSVRDHRDEESSKKRHVILSGVPHGRRRAKRSLSDCLKGPPEGRPERKVVARGFQPRGPNPRGWKAPRYAAPALRPPRRRRPGQVEAGPRASPFHLRSAQDDTRFLTSGPPSQDLSPFMRAGRRGRTRAWRVGYLVFISKTPVHSPSGGSFCNARQRARKTALTGSPGACASTSRQSAAAVLNSPSR